MKIPAILLASLFLVACGSGGTSSAIPSSGAQPLSPTAALEARIVAEKTGAIPTLDRSSSLLGTDADGNGVRDDIDAYINSLPDTPVQKASLRQHSSALNATLAADLTNPASVSNASNKIMSAVSCLFDTYRGTDPDKKLATLKKYTVNTKERFTAYMKYNQALSGSMLSLPPRGTACVP